MIMPTPFINIGIICLSELPVATSKGLWIVYDYSNVLPDYGAYNINDFGFYFCIGDF